MEKAREFHKPIYIWFIDLRKANDSVNRNSLWTVLQHSYGIPTNSISIIRALHEHSVAAIRCYGKISDVCRHKWCPSGPAIEVDSRICKVSKALHSLCCILWYQCKMKTRTKLHIFYAVELPTLLFGLESLIIHEPQFHRLQGFVMLCLRVILRVSVREKKWHTTIRRMPKQQKLSSVLSQCRFRFLGHISRMNDIHLPKQLLVCALWMVNVQQVGRSIAGMI